MADEQKKLHIEFTCSGKPIMYDDKLTDDAQKKFYQFNKLPEDLLYIKIKVGDASCKMILHTSEITKSQIKKIIHAQETNTTYLFDIENPNSVIDGSIHVCGGKTQFFVESKTYSPIDMSIKIPNQYCIAELKRLIDYEDDEEPSGEEDNEGDEDNEGGEESDEKPKDNKRKIELADTDQNKKTKL